MIEKVDLTSEEPTPPTNTDDKIAMLKYSKKYDRFIDREEGVNRELNNLYSLIWGECKVSVKDKVRANTQFAEKNNQSDSLWLLKTIQSLSYSYNSNK